MTDQQRALLARLKDAGFPVYESESSFSLDEDGCFELCFSSDLDTYPVEESPTGEEEAEEARRVAAAIASAGAAVVAMNAACWSGWSEYTPDPGDVRFVKVRLP